MDHEKTEINYPNSPETYLPPRCSSCPCWYHTQCAAGGKVTCNDTSSPPEHVECPSCVEFSALPSQ